MTRREMALIVTAFLMLFIGLECGYRIGKRAPVSQSQAVAYDSGFQACQEQF